MYRAETSYLDRELGRLFAVERLREGVVPSIGADVNLRAQPRDTLRDRSRAQLDVYPTGAGAPAGATDSSCDHTTL